MRGNDFIKLLLQSPLHGLLSGNTLLITVTGRKTGRPITTPVNYVREGDTLWVLSRRERKWWRNLRAGAPVRLRLGGRDVEAFAETVLDEAEVAAHLVAYLKGIPLSARTLGISITDGKPDPEGLAHAARSWLLVRITRIF